MLPSQTSPVQLRFTKADTAQTPAKGRVLDHMSFDVKDLEAFIKTLEANNVKLDSSCTVNEARIGIAFGLEHDLGDDSRVRLVRYVDDIRVPVR
jgi:hypothetical protein